jgi:hypothetical protein
MNKLKLNEQGWGDANDAIEKEKQEKQKQQQQDLEKQKTDREKKKTTPTPPVQEKNPVNRAGKLVRANRAKNDIINSSLIQDLSVATKRAKIGDVQITYAVTGHDQKVDGTEITSRHYSGDAVDISMINGVSYNSNPKMFTTLGNILAAELKKMGYVPYEQKLGKKSLIWQTTDHYNHLHVSNMPSATMNTQQKEIHKQVQRARWDMYNIITKFPDRYFQNFKSVFKPGAGGRVIGSDNEEAAAKWLKDSFNLTWESKFKTWENKAHEHDVQNMKNLRLIVQHVHKLILDHESGKATVSFWNYDEPSRKWKQVKRTYRWDYL